MFKLIGWIIKTTLFSALILVVGHLVRFKGETLSDWVGDQVERVSQLNFTKEIKHYANRALPEDTLTHSAAKSKIVHKKQNEDGIRSTEREALEKMLK